MKNSKKKSKLNSNSTKKSDKKQPENLTLLDEEKEAKLKNKKKRIKSKYHTTNFSQNCNKTRFLFFILPLIVVILIIFLYKVFKSVPLIGNTTTKKIIPLGFALNNEYTYPLMVSLTSILYNAGSSTFYIFNIMFGEEFLDSNKEKISSLTKKYHNCQINFLDLKDKYKGWKTFNHYPISTYYRLSIADLVPYDKILYLDCDTLVHGDLGAVYDIDLKNYYFMGFPNDEIATKVIDGTRNFIGAGVMLMNLKELRKLNASILFEKYYRQHGAEKGDETLINYVFCHNIAFFPMNIGCPDFVDKLTPENFYERYKGYLNVSKETFVESTKDPIISHNHYTTTKWWNRNITTLTKIGKKWIFYASKSTVFQEICEKYSQYKDICAKI